MALGSHGTVKIQVSNLLNQEGDVGCISCSIRTSHIELNGVAVNVTNDDGPVHE